MTVRSDITQEQLDSLSESADYATDFEVMAARASIERDLAIADLARKGYTVLERIEALLLRKFGV